MKIDEPEDQVELPTGTELDGRFRILSLLGEGGMGCVYLAEDLQHGHEVALKVLIPRYRGRPERERRLLNEAELARRVGDHPGMPRLYGAGRLRDLGGCPYVAWEVVHGRDLNAVLTLRYVIPPRLAAQWARQLVDALCAMHRAGVVHRDVTVTNVFIERPDGDAKVKLIDLSHAAVVPESGTPSRRLTREIEIPGALGFMPPEQTLALPPHPKMDVFSFGVVLHEMLTGTNPFEHVRDRDAYIELQRAGKLHVPRIDRRVYPGVPEALIELVEGCTRNDVARRIDMIEVRRRLDEVLGRMSTSVRLVTDEPTSAPFEESSAAVVGAAPAEQGEVAAERPGSRRTMLVVALAVVLSTAVLIAILWRGVGSVGEPGPLAPVPLVEPGPDVGQSTVVEPRVDPAPAPTTAAEPAPVKPAAPGGTPSEQQPTKVEEPKDEPPSSGGKGKPAAAVRLPAHGTDACRRAVADALDANEAQAWSRLEALTRKKKCFQDRNQWARLRVHALSETGRFAECAALGDKIQDPVVKQYARICKAQETDHR